MEWKDTIIRDLQWSDAIINREGELHRSHSRDRRHCALLQCGGNFPGRLARLYQRGLCGEAGEEVWATIDLKTETGFNQIILTNRNFQEYLNTKAVSFYGSNDGTTFMPIKENVELPGQKENIITLDAKVSYRYLKMTFDRWDASQGGTMQFAELGLKG